MKIKKYIGQTTHEAMSKLKIELGPDAVILNTKTIRQKGLFGYFRKPLIEITAAYEEKDLLRKKFANPYEDKLKSINEELTELKELMMKTSIDKRKDTDIPSTLLRFHDLMLNNGVNPKVSSSLLKEISKGVNLEEKDINTVTNIVRFGLAEALGTPEPITIGREQKIIFFVGPTGVGKTTTLAKITADFVIKNKYDIGLITSDIYRIAAVEQLKIYSEILQLPLEIAYNKDDILRAINNFKDKDIILVDTAGRNHNDLNQIEELKDILNITTVKEVFLLISAATDYKLLRSLVEKYNFLNDYKIIITKIDEVESYGSILNIRHITKKQLSYYTTGQNVPDDIQLIDVESIVNKLIGENSND